MKNRLLMLLATIMMVAFSCSKEKTIDPSLGNTQAQKSVLGWSTVFTPSSFDLMAGQNIYIGTVYFELVGAEPTTANLKVTYALVNGWQMNQIHFWIGTDQNAYPKVKSGTGKGSPIPGQFPYKFENLGAVSTYSFEVPPIKGTTWCGNTFYFIPHTAVQLPNGDGTYQTQTAWADGWELPGSNWAMESSFSVTCKQETTCTGWGNDNTAFGGNFVGLDNKPWWYYYDATIGGAQNITAGQHITIGSAIYDATAGTITISFINGWGLKDVDESVKINGYDVIPTQRQESGDFPWKGKSLVVNVAPFPYYIIHLDVHQCTSYE